jgi:enamine deaminase RidA (YjgF/YER057c/UK114 family)
MSNRDLEPQPLQGGVESDDISPEDAESRLSALGITLPSAPAAAANYMPVMRVDDLLYVSGQVASEDGRMVVSGRLGAEVDVEGGRACARRCAINLIAQLRAELEDLSRVRQFVKITVFVASTDDFTQQHLVANGASELFVEVFGDDGRHARSAVGVANLPLGSPVEVEAIVQFE